MRPNPFPAAFALLEDQRNLAVEAALVEALPSLDPVAQAAGVEMLVRRGFPQGQGGLVGRFGSFDGALQHIILRHVRDLYAGVRLAMAGGAVEERLGAIEVIRRGGEGPLVYLLGTALRTRCPTTREAAAEALSEMSDRLREQLDGPTLAEGMSSLSNYTGCITDALRGALLGWEIHVQPKVLLACLRHIRWLEDALLAKLEEPRTRVAHAIGSLVAGTADPHLAGFVLRALAIPPLRSAAIQAIAHARAPRFLGALGRQRWLLADPRIERACLRIREMRWLEEGGDILASLAVPEAAGLIALIGATGVRSERKMGAYRSVLSLGVPELEAAVMWQLIVDEHPAATDLLGMAAGRTSGVARRVADRELKRRQVEPFVPGQGLSQADATERGPEQAPTREDWVHYWSRFDELSAEQQATDAEALRRVGEDLLVPLQAKLGSSLPLERARALRIVARLGLASQVEERVYRLTSDLDSVVRSAAVSLLVDLPGTTAHRILRRMLDDPDDRVQANAVDVLDEMDAAGREELLEPKLESSNSRVRANAVKALLRLELQEAGETLIAMLDDPSRAQRLSALWVVERLKLEAVVRRVELLSRTDHDERVRKRAGRVLKKLAGDRQPPLDGAPREVGAVGADRARSTS